MNGEFFHINRHINKTKRGTATKCDCPSFCIHAGLQQFFLAIELFLCDVPFSQFLLQDIQSGFFG